MPLTDIQIVETNHLPHVEVGRMRHGIQCHPHLAWIFKRLGISTFWGWGPWIAFTKEGGPFMMTDPMTGRPKLIMTKRQSQALSEKLIHHTPAENPLFRYF